LNIGGTGDGTNSQETRSDLTTHIVQRGHSNLPLVRSEAKNFAQFPTRPALRFVFELIDN
jgi:hypothetical protein